VGVSKKVYVSRRVIDADRGYLGEEDILRVCFSVQVGGDERYCDGSHHSVGKILRKLFRDEGHRNFYGLPDPDKENPENVKKKGGIFYQIEKYPLLENCRKRIEGWSNEELAEDEGRIEIKTEYPPLL